MKRNIHFSSDLHFYHENVIKYCDRPFKSVEEMNEKLIKNWNSVVKPNDLVYILGDVTWNHDPKAYRMLLESLNGEKILVKGNHDQITELRALKHGYRLMLREAVIKIGSYHLRLSHYPYRSSNFRHFWNKFVKFFGFRGFLERYRYLRPKKSNMVLLHGHTHQKDHGKGKEIHIGVDAWNYFPVSSNKIVEIIRKREGK